MSLFLSCTHQRKIASVNDCESLIKEILNNTNKRTSWSAELTNKEKLFSRYPALIKTYRNIGKGLPKPTAKISEVKEIPFHLSNALRPKGAKGQMYLRAAQLPEKLQRSIVNSYNALADNIVLEKYFKELFLETASWMDYRSKNVAISLLTKGKIDEAALGSVIVKRLKSRGDDRFMTLRKRQLPSSGRIDLKRHGLSEDHANHSFRTAIGIGPFFDYSFDPWRRDGHGAFTHMIQRDIISQYALSKDPDDFDDFWQYLATPKGVAFWLDLFDAGKEVNSFHKPENVTKYIVHYLGSDAGSGL